MRSPNFSPSCASSTSHLVLDGESCRLNAPAGVLTEEHKRDLAEHKAEIIEFLRAAEQLAGAAARDRAAAGRAERECRSSPPPGTTATCSAYRALSQHLGPDQPFFGLQPPGSRKAANR